MTLVKWKNQPFFSDIFDNLFEKEFNPMIWKGLNTMPSTNIIEKKDSYLLEIAIPGLEKEDFKINLENNILTISSEKENEKVEEEKNYTRKEFMYGAFSRSFTLPKEIDAEKINAEYKNGILKVALPKKEEAQNPSKIIEIS